jgi:hypothetical protein
MDWDVGLAPIELYRALAWRAVETCVFRKSPLKVLSSSIIVAVLMFGLFR